MSRPAHIVTTRVPRGVDVPRGADAFGRWAAAIVSALRKGFGAASHASAAPRLPAKPAHRV